MQVGVSSRFLKCEVGNGLRCLQGTRLQVGKQRGKTRWGVVREAGQGVADRVIPVGWVTVLDLHGQMKHSSLVLWTALPPSKVLISTSGQGTGDSCTAPCQAGFDLSQPALHNYFPGCEWHRQHGNGVFQTRLPALGIHPIPGYYVLIT